MNGDLRIIVQCLQKIITVVFNNQKQITLVLLDQNNNSLNKV
jgi:hypothetical protein